MNTAVATLPEWHIGGSLGCNECGLRGFVSKGRWVPAE